MDVLEYRGVEYPRYAKCKYCDTAVMLSFTDVTVRDSALNVGNTRKSIIFGLAPSAITRIQ